ncbi:hypothetical protein ILUMI_16906, partial [Ignelater luminosus]
QAVDTAIKKKKDGGLVTSDKREDCKESGFGPESIAKEWLYSQIFNCEYNYSFKSPDNDTCDLCDQLQHQIREAESLESRKSLQAEYDEHLADTNNRHKMKPEDKKI